MQKNHVTGVEYTNGNSAQLSDIQTKNGYKASEWLTFLQAKEKGLMIKKGSKGVRLVRVFDTDKGELGKEKKAVKAFTVFNIEQLTECPVCYKPFINGTCAECDELVASL
jgi:antirestriction protein ArdC